METKEFPRLPRQGYGLFAAKIWFKSQLSLKLLQVQDMSCKEFFDFPVARHGLRNARLRVTIPVVFPAVPDEDTSGFFQLADQIRPPHPTDSSATLRMPEISPLVRSP